MSKLFALDKSDLLKGLVVTVITAILTLLLRILESKGLAMDITDLQTILSTGLSAGIGYILKNFLTDDVGQLGGKYKI